jgi:hypothetical protein
MLPYIGMDDDELPRAMMYWQIADMVENEPPEQRDEWEDEIVSFWEGHEQRRRIDMSKNAYKIRFRNSEKEKKLRLRKIADLYHEWLYNTARDKKKKVLSEFNAFVDEASYEPYSENRPSLYFYGKKVDEAKERWEINADLMDSKKKKSPKKGGKTKKRKGRNKKK